MDPVDWRTIAPMSTSEMISCAIGAMSTFPMIVCTSTTKRAAMVIGSSALSGAEPWPPRPLKVISIASEFDDTGPLL